MLALSIRQPFAELILRGHKTVEYRSRPTRIVGQRFWIYAALHRWRATERPWPVKRADNIVVPDEQLPDWMMELAQTLILDNLPRGVIVGSAVISRCSAPTDGGLYHWHLADVKRLSHPRRPERHPQPGWFRPF